MSVQSLDHHSVPCITAASYLIVKFAILCAVCVRVCAVFTAMMGIFLLAQGCVTEHKGLLLIMFSS